jgi:hypothetical protein
MVAGAETGAGAVVPSIGAVVVLFCAVVPLPRMVTFQCM